MQPWRLDLALSTGQMATERRHDKGPVTAGTNTLVGRDSAAILREVGEILAGRGKGGRAPELWDGQAAQRIAVDLGEWLLARHAGDCLGAK